MVDARSLIRSLGGSSNVAADIGSTRDAVRAWYRIGIPHKHWPAIKALAAKNGLSGIDDDALQATREGQAA